MDDPEDFGHLLRRLRTARPLTQTALAQQVGCSLATIKKIEAGTRRPSPQLAARLADRLGAAGSEWDTFLGSVPGTRDRSVTAPAAPRGNLPQQLTSFIGRAQEIALITGLVQAAPARLLTLTGSGGCGKTRLAYRVAGDIVGEYPDGVCAVELAALVDPRLVPQALAAALRLPAHLQAAASAQVVEALRRRALLLVLDNCEHLLAACAALADAIVRACPRVRILATSREQLGVAGEAVHRVPSMALPDISAGKDPTPEDLARIEQTEAVRLFVERARAAWSGFELTAQNAGALVRICHRVAGIPLALELAAARVRLLRVEEIAAHLDDGLGLLAGGGRGAVARHRTLQAAIDWSHDLLLDAERVLLRRLAVFAGGFTLAEAHSVCTDAALPPDALFDVLARLVDQSLVIAGHDAVPTRYRLLEPIRQYAGGKLQAAGEAETFQDRHADAFVALAEEAAPQLWDVAHTVWLARLRQEHDNLRMAVRWAVGRSDAALGARLARALYWFWFLTGSLSEGRRSVAGILAVASTAGEDAARAGVLRVAGYLAFLDADYAARGPLEESAAICRRLGDRPALADTLNVLGRVRLLAGDAAAGGSCSVRARRPSGRWAIPVGRPSRCWG